MACRDMLTGDRMVGSLPARVMLAGHRPHRPPAARTPSGQALVVEVAEEGGHELSLWSSSFRRQDVGPAQGRGFSVLMQSELPGSTAVRRLATRARSCRAASRRRAGPLDPPSCSVTPSRVGHDARWITQGWRSSRSVGCEQLGESSLGHLEDGQRLEEELRCRPCHVLDLVGVVWVLTTSSSTVWWVRARSRILRCSLIAHGVPGQTAPGAHGRPRSGCWRTDRSGQWFRKLRRRRCGDRLGTGVRRLVGVVSVRCLSAWYRLPGPAQNPRPVWLPVGR